MRHLRFLLILSLVSLATKLAFMTLRSPMTGIDDANIFFVYARSISAGEGFVFNPGSERVEGFTSFLWAIICSGAVAIAGPPERILLALNILLVSLTIHCCLRVFVLKPSEGTFTTPMLWVSAFVLLLLSDFPFVTWNTLTLMETGMWTAVLTAASIVVIEPRPGRKDMIALAFLVTLLILARPEAFVWAPVLCGVFYLRRRSSRGSRIAIAETALPLLSFVVTAGLLTIFRVMYFGLPLPNTYYAKVSPSLSYSLVEGSRYLQTYLLSGPVPVACGSAVLLSVLHLINVRFRDERTFALTALVLVGLAVPVLTGGDHFDGFRFYQAVYPLLLLCLLNVARFIVPQYAGGASLQAFPQNTRVVTAAIGVGVLLTLQITGWILTHSYGLKHEFDIAAHGRRQGQRINLLFSDVRPLPDIGTISVGGLKYVYDGPVIDLMGLNHTKMAHNGGDRVGLRSHAAFEKRTFYELKPAIVVPLAEYSVDLQAAEQRNSFVDMALKGLLQDSRFRDDYRLAEVRTTTPQGTTALSAWYDRRFLSRLMLSGAFEITFADGHAH